MSLVGPDGRPIASSSSSSYRPQNMMVVVSMVNNITQQPEFTFQVIIPFAKFEWYMANPHHFTLTINNMVAQTYANNILKEQEPISSAEEFNTRMNGWMQAVASKYSIALSEPLAVDAIYQDASDHAKYAQDMGSATTEDASSEEEQTDEGEGVVN